MKNLLNWIKSNVISVVSIVAVLLALGFLGWVHVQGTGLQERAAQEAKKTATLASFANQRVEVPPDNPDEPPEVKGPLTINTPEIEQMRSVNQEMDNEYQGIFSFAVERNRAGKMVLIEDLFPEAKTVANPFIARDFYREAFEVMLGPADLRIEYPPAETSNAVINSGVDMLNTLPRLDAGMPPTDELIQRELTEVEETFMTKGLVATSTTLTEDDQRQLEEEKRNRLMEVLIDQAQSIHVYAETDINSPQFPFDIGAIGPQDDPTPAQLWEAQIELWAQQDIVSAIAAANQTDNPEASVITAPVKRLLRMEVTPGYVGLQNLGAVRGKAAASQLADFRYTAPSKLTGSADERQSDNFYASPTGRVSNALYDVRHTVVTALVDFQQLPKLFESISNVNMMTVVGCKISGVDEYDALIEGFVYGPSDVVQAEMIIESVWLRDWTTQLMHDHVKMYLGIIEPDPAMQGKEIGPGFGGPGFGPGGIPGGYPGGPGGYEY